MELRLPSPTQLRQIFETELKEAFPPAELKPLSSMERMWQEGRYKPLCLFDGDEILGAAFLWLGRPGWAILDYLCVFSSCRKKYGGTGERVQGFKTQPIPMHGMEYSASLTVPALSITFYTLNK